MTTKSNWVLDASHVSAAMKKYVSQTPGVRNMHSELDFLNTLIADARIQMRVEIKTSPTAAEQIVNYNPAIATKVFRNDAAVHRVALVHDRSKSNFYHPLTFESNCLIFDASTWNVICFTPRALNPKFTRKVTIANLHKCEIYAAADGTTVTLYHYAGKWRFATANGVDVGEYKWIGELTYTRAFDEVMKLYPGFSYDKLKTDHSYSIGFRHGDFHKFIADPASAWVIRAVNLTTGVDVNIRDIDIGVPAQLPIARETFGEKLTSEQLFDELNARSMQALAQYMEFARGELLKNPTVTALEIAKSIAAKSRNDPAVTANIHYGYILRSPLREGNFVSNILIESELMKVIRQFMYNLPKPNLFECFGKQIVIDNSNREKYCMLRNFLDRGNLPTFQALFPQYDEKLVEFNARIEVIVDKVLECNRRKPSGAIGGTSIDDQIATAMHQFISSTESSGQLIGSRDVVRDFILDVRNMRTVGLMLSEL